MLEEIQTLSNPKCNTPSFKTFGTDSKVKIPQIMSSGKYTFHLKSVVQYNTHIISYLLKAVQYLLKNLITFLICEE
jgi:hypothetical protein